MDTVHAPIKSKLYLKTLGRISYITATACFHQDYS